MVGATLAELRGRGPAPADAVGRIRTLDHVSVKEAVLPFDRFPDVDTLLGPEMRSTGEVMGIDRTFGLAFAKSQIAAGTRLPQTGTVFLSLADRDKPAGLAVARRFGELGFSLAATLGTAGYLRDHGSPSTRWWRRSVRRAWPPTRVELIAGGKVQLVVNTPRGRGAAGRRRPHPGGRHRPPRPVPDDAGRGPGRGRRHRRLGRPHTVRPRPPGAPRRVDRPGACTGPDLSHQDRVGGAAEPGHDGLGHRRPRGRAGGVRSAGPVGGGRGQVAGGRAVAGQPGATGARGRRPGC